MSIFPHQEDVSEKGTALLLSPQSGMEKQAPWSAVAGFHCFCCLHARQLLGCSVTVSFGICRVARILEFDCPLFYHVGWVTDHVGQPAFKFFSKSAG